MADITKCEGGDCPLKERCYRYTAEADELHQSYFVEVPYNGTDCDHYWGPNAETVWADIKPKNSV